MKTLLTSFFKLSLLCALSSVKLCAQQQDSLIRKEVYADSFAHSAPAGNTLTEASGGPQPVYFNYRRRRLVHKGRPLDGLLFLKMCRAIGDSAVQEQVARYDELSREKQRLGFGMLGSSFTGFALLGGVISNSAGEPELSSMLGLASGIAILAVPAMAIYSSVPHRQRKAVLFRDLPIAYNAYVEACRAGACSQDH